MNKDNNNEVTQQDNLKGDVDIDTAVAKGSAMNMHAVTTPQKDILSPPPVTRKISFQKRRAYISSNTSSSLDYLYKDDNYDHDNQEEEEERGVKDEGINDCSNGEAEGDTADIVVDNDGYFYYKQKNDADHGKNNHDTDDYDDDMGSMVSQYGSDAGNNNLAVAAAASLKLAELDVMLEEEEEGEEELEEGDDNGKEKNGNEEISAKDIIVGQELVQRNNHNNNQDNEEEGEGDEGSGGSVDSVDLDSSSSSSSSSSSALPIGRLNHEHLLEKRSGASINTTNTTTTMTTTDAAASPPRTPLTKLKINTLEDGLSHHNQEEGSPKTPTISSVSAALRRLGNNVSHMTRCNKLSPSSLSFGGGGGVSVGIDGDHDRQQDLIYNHGSHKQKMWLSPRFDRPTMLLHRQDDDNLELDRPPSLSSWHPEQQQQQLKYGADINRRITTNYSSSSIHQPTLMTSQSYNSHFDNQNQQQHKSMAMMGGITSCLSFDPESGKRPYGNMRWSDSPPSSPVPSSTWRQQQHHRPRTTSFGEGGGGISMGIGGGGGDGDMERHHASPKHVNSNSTIPILVLQSPQRVGDIEREDALDLLELLVERSIAFHENMIVGDTANCKALSTVDHDKVARNEMSSEGKILPDLDNFQECIDALYKISCEYEKNREHDCEYPNHDNRMTVLRQIVDSHTYAMEMKQAALSASTWLTSIGRKGGNKRNYKRLDEAMPMSQYISEEKLHQMDAKELRSLVHAAHAQLLEKNEINEKLEYELSSCRGEIGRLKTALSKQENSFVSPNKSILDEDVNDDSSDDSDSQPEFPESSEINFDVDEATNRLIHENAESTAMGMIEARKEILLLRAELNEANRLLENMKKGTSINKLDVLESIVQGDASDAIKGGDADNDSLIPRETEIIDDNIDAADTKNDLIQISSEQSTSTLLDGLKEELESYVSTIRKADKEEIHNLQLKLDRLGKAIAASRKEKDDENNAHISNAENHVTNWHKLDPLPPPPDHDLRSPIVQDLLSQWTNDVNTHESLLSWVERVLQGQKILDVAPLQLSGLNQELRDGFLMHVLPFLLRRSDINVEVTTREHRETSYDLSVVVTETEVNHADYLDRRHEVNSISKSLHMMAFKASAAKASINVSDHVQTPEKKKQGSFHFTPHESSVSYDPHSERNDQTGHHQSGIVAGALSAMGGFLSRRRTPVSSTSSSNNQQQSPRNAFSLPSTPVSPQTNGIFSNEEGNFMHSNFNDSSQPYHRVVSAPPGRIGMTFVQYRGHAMVSDVYKDSPLAGWVFPSDILIAIDEVPVSGMRVAEIVKLLTARKDRQRSLRVISSHAMTELLTSEQCDYPSDG